MELTKKELLDINGGIGAWAVIGIAAGIIFLIGAIDGYVRPMKCN